MPPGVSDLLDALRQTGHSRVLLQNVTRVPLLPAVARAVAGTRELPEPMHLYETPSGVVAWRLADGSHVYDAALSDKDALFKAILESRTDVLGILGLEHLTAADPGRARMVLERTASRVVASTHRPSMIDRAVASRFSAIPVPAPPVQSGGTSTAAARPWRHPSLPRP